MNADRSVVVPGQKVRHYYHVYATGGRWRKMVRDHLDALAASGIRWDLRVGIVGDAKQTMQVVAELPDQTPWRSWADGFEQRTLSMLHHDLAGDDYDGPVLYAHTKGAGYPAPGSAAWRECMTSKLVRDAKACLDLIRGGADTVGCHLLTPDAYPNIGDVPYYGGNFWWATSDHLRRLGEPQTDHRYRAESWVTSVPPKNYPVNLVPGWPGTLCETHL